MVYIKRTLTYIRGGKVRFFVAYLVLTPLVAFFSTLFAYLITPVMEAASAHNGKLLLKYSLLILAAGILNCVLAYINEIINIRLLKEAENSLRKKGFEKIILQSPVDFYNRNTNEYLSVLENDIKMISENFLGGFLSIYSIAWSFVISFFAVSYLEWKVSIFVLGFSLLSVLIPRLYENSLNKKMLQFSNALSKWLEKTKDLLDGFTVLKTFRIRKQAIAAFGEHSQTLSEEDIRKETAFTQVGYISMGFSQLTFLGVVLLGALMVYDGNMGAGVVLALSQMIGGIIAPFEGLPRQIARVKSVGQLYEKWDSIVAEKREITSEFFVTEDVNVISLEQVGFSYDKDKVLFRDLNFTFETNKKYVIVGPSGSGKSSLAKLLLRLYEPEHGVIRWNGTDISQYSDEEYYGVLCYQQQSVFLFDDTMEYNITLGRQCSREKLQEIIRNCGLYDIIEKLERGMDTVLSENGNILSGGERQRVGIARCMVEKPKMIIWDESFANLDVARALQMEELVISMRDCGCVLITHHFHPTILRKCDSILYMENGRIEESGSFEELNQFGKKFYNLMNSEMGNLS